MHTNHHGNNALMQCVFKKSEGALNLLLGILLSMECNDTNKDLIYHILHQRNTLGFTLLGLILHYQQGMLLPQQIALELEKYCHTVADDKVKTI